MDDMVSDYLEFMWSEGEGRAAASTFLAALQDAEPKLKGHLPGSWRLMKTWVANEVPSRAPPMSESVLRAMVGWAVLHEHEEFALSLLVAFLFFSSYWGIAWTASVANTHAKLFYSSCSEPRVDKIRETSGGS
jgi:hypothetical protein